jgi:hypothetical protein
MKDRNGNLIRMNEGVDPNMIGMEYRECAKGAHMYATPLERARMARRRLRYLEHDLTAARALGRQTTRIARHVGRKRPAA